MKQKSLLLFVAAMLALGMPAVHAKNTTSYPQSAAPAPVKSAWTVNIRTIRAFEQYTTMLAKARPLVTTTVKSMLTNSSLTNSRPNGYTMVIPLLAVTHNGTTDYYYIDNAPNGSQVYFTVPNIASVSYATLYTLGDNFRNWEFATLTIDGTTQIWGDADPGGNNWITFYGTFDIVNSVDIIVY